MYYIREENNGEKVIFINEYFAEECVWKDFSHNFSSNKGVNLLAELPFLLSKSFSIFLYGQ